MNRFIPVGLFLSMAGLVLLLTPNAPLTALQKGKAKAKAHPQEVEAARAAATVPAGHQVQIWASEPLMANPVSFCFDHLGRAYVAETTRFGNGVPDTRQHMYWLDEDIGARTVEDRLAMYAKHGYGKNTKLYTEYDDQIRMVWDSTGAGVADKSTIFASGFNQLKDGLGSGVLAHKGSVYYTNIPDLYLLKDVNGDGIAEQKTSLATGFGVRVQFIGHDMHGLRMGPDGRLYFSIGDRGLTVVNKEGKTLANPDSGAVLRCDLDGSNLELVHVGLRNPQELAFDDFGNLFTYDNNCDSGDRARWVYIVDGGDSGWRCGYQYGENEKKEKALLFHTAKVPQGNRGPWNAEKIWHTQTPDQPAYIVPPLAHFGNGPAGLTHYPGVGLNSKYQDHFFACDFTSNPGGSKIWTLKVKPKGAAFEVSKPEPFVQNMVPTDCEFGPDGAFYWSDWVGGWSPPGKGRIFRVEDPEAMKNPAVGEAKKLLAEGFTKLDAKTLAKLLDHPHKQVRLEAQWQLATMPAAFDEFRNAISQATTQLGKLHGAWGLGMLARKNHEAAIKALLDATTNKDEEVQAQAFRALNWLPTIPASAKNTLVAALESPASPRVLSFAVRVYGKLAGEKSPEYFAPLFRILKSNNDQDVYLRQAVVAALATNVEQPCDVYNAWVKMKKEYDVPAVRLGIVLAQRKLECQLIGNFLVDADQKVVTEAARAIHDQNLMTPMGTLAKLIDTPGLNEATLFRVLSANFKLGQVENAQKLAVFAARADQSEELRIAALKLLAMWGNPSKRDAITGLRQDLPSRDPSVAVEAIKPVLSGIFRGNDAVRKEAVLCSTKLGIKDVIPFTINLVKDSKQLGSTRVEALFALDAMKAPELRDLLTVVAESSEPALRGAGLLLSAKLDPQVAKGRLPKVIQDAKATIIEKQYALQALGQLPESNEADALLQGLLTGYTTQVPAALQLEVLEAAQARVASKVKLHENLAQSLAQLNAAMEQAAAKDHLAKHRFALEGGDAVRGRSIFLNNAAVSCQRCHKLDGEGGEVGPIMNGVSKEKTREYLLEAIVAPSKVIAKGYESITLNLLDGRTLSGVLKAKDAKGYTIITAENKVLTIPVDEVDSTKPDKSAMPEDIPTKLSNRELRDLVEFLTTLNEAPAK